MATMAQIKDGLKTTISNISGLRCYDTIPDNAINYITELEKFIETKVASISTSPERNDTILIVDPFSN